MSTYMEAFTHFVNTVFLTCGLILTLPFNKMRGLVTCTCILILMIKFSLLVNSVPKNINIKYIDLFLQESFPFDYNFSANVISYALLTHIYLT